MGKSVYWRFGKEYIKLKRNEIIKKGAMQSWSDGELLPIMGGEETIGDIPASFNEERDFYNLKEEYNDFKILCPFCNAPYTAKMEEYLQNAKSATSPSGYGASATVEITIFCSNCKRMVYKKETTIT